MSPSKCSVMVTEGRDPEELAQVRAILGVERIHFEEKYLGLPTPNGRMKRAVFQPLAARFQKRMMAWKEKDMSAAAKEILIKSVAQALPNYIMSIFKLSGGLCESLMRKIRAYWWDSEKGRRKVQWVPWSSMIQPKGAGGMGFKDLKLFNQALLAKEAWRLLVYPDSLCARVLKAKYFPDGNLLDIVTASTASPTWRAIEYNLELLKHGNVWRVGNGSLLRIWRDNWIPRPHNLKPIGSLRTCRLRRVEHLIDREARCWDETLIRRFFFPCDVEEILKIKIPLQECDDWMAWNCEKTGVFTVKSGYRLAMQLADGAETTGSSVRPDGERCLWTKLWTAQVPSKVRVFAWKVVKNGLPTRANKHRRHLETQGICELCGHACEDVFHAVIECPHARALREAMREH